MLKNINYNILESVTILSKSLYRYETYIQDAAECESCRKLWSAFRKQRETELSALLMELKKHFEAEEASIKPAFPDKIEWGLY